MITTRNRLWVWLILGFGIWVLLGVLFMGPTSLRSPATLRDHLDSAWMSVEKALTREPLEPTAEVYPFLEADLGAPNAGFRRLRANGTFWHWFRTRAGEKPAAALVDEDGSHPAGKNRAPSADSNVLEIPVGDQRAGAVFFVDECLTRGLTNSISVGDLRRWATNTIQTYRVKQIGSDDPISARIGEVAAADVPSAIRSMQERIPSCRRTGLMDGVESVELVKVYSQSLGISEEEADERLSTIAPDPSPPQVGFHRTQDGILAVTITWYSYGIIVGPESFEPDRTFQPWYQRKLADGVFLWHGSK